MRKQGFTLAELIITLGIIGVGAALIAPALGNLMPDKNKLTVLNTAKTINEVTEKLLDNSHIYYKTGTCIGLGCQGAPLDEDYASYSGKSKFANLLVASLNADGDVTRSDSSISFRAADGAFWTVEPTDVGGATIVIDVDGAKGKNCLYNSESCKKPDQFKFVVDQFGGTHAGDALTMAYTQNPTNTKDKKKDLEAAAKLDVPDWSNAKLAEGNDRYAGVTMPKTGDNADVTKPDTGDNSKPHIIDPIIVRRPIIPEQPITPEEPTNPVNPCVDQPDKGFYCKKDDLKLKEWKEPSSNCTNTGTGLDRINKYQDTACFKPNL